MILHMKQIDKLVVNFPIEPLHVNNLLTVYEVCWGQSLISDKTNDRDTSYFYVLKWEIWANYFLSFILLIYFIQRMKLYHQLSFKVCHFGYLRPAKIQISLRIRAVWSESSLAAFRIAKAAKFLHAHNEDFDQTARTRRLIWVFVGRTCPKVRCLVLRLIHSNLTF